MADANFVLLEERGVLAVSGDDRRSFLQGLVSNDVDKIGPAQTRYAALLTAQGKYLHDFFMIEADDAILLDAEAAGSPISNDGSRSTGCAPKSRSTRDPTSS